MVAVEGTSNREVSLEVSETVMFPPTTDPAVTVPALVTVPAASDTLAGRVRVKVVVFVSWTPGRED